MRSRAKREEAEVTGVSESSGDRSDGTEEERERRLHRGVIKNFSIIVAVCRNCRGKTRMVVGEYPLSTDMWA